MGAWSLEREKKTVVARLLLLAGSLLTPPRIAPSRRWRLVVWSLAWCARQVRSHERPLAHERQHGVAGRRQQLGAAAGRWSVNGTAATLLGSGEGAGRRGTAHARQPEALAPPVADVPSSASSPVKEASSGRQQVRQRVAVVLSGHYRSHDKCAASVKKNILKARGNEAFDFSIFVATYEQRYGLLINHAKTSESKKKETITAQTVSAQYPDWPVEVKVYDSEKFKTTLTNYAKLHKTRSFRTIRISCMLKIIAVANEMVQQAETAGRFSFVLKTRLDLQFLAPFVLSSRRPALNKAGLQYGVVVPTTMQRGPSRLAKLTTKECNGNGSKVPVWVQDHIAYGDSRSMHVYIQSTYERFVSHPRIMVPERHLAMVLKDKKLRVFCDEHIKYTIIR